MSTRKESPIQFTAQTESARENRRNHLYPIARGVLAGLAGSAFILASGRFVAEGLEERTVAETTVGIIPGDGGTLTVCEAVDDLATRYDFDPDSVHNCTYAGIDVHGELVDLNGGQQVQTGQQIVVRVKDRDLTPGMSVEADPVYPEGTE